MRDFDEIVAMAAEPRGGISALEESLAKTRPLKPAEVAVIPDDRILSEMSRRVFHAGFSWKVVDAKWDAFEEAFAGFDPHSCASMTDERFDELLKDVRIVRNAAKIRSVALNGRFVLDLAAEHGSAARAFADWPDTDYVAALIREGVLAREPSGKRDFAAIQEAFNQWSAESGRDLTSISRILAMSIGGGTGEGVQSHPGYRPPSFR
jgi:hypothetical protein